MSWYNRCLLSSQLNGDFKFRQYFIDSIEDNKYFRVVRNLRGEPVGFRLVLFFFNKQDSILFSKYLTECDIYFSTGYSLIGSEFKSSLSLVNRIIDIPIDKKLSKRNYLSLTIYNWLKFEL